MTEGAVDGMARDVERFLREVVGLDLPVEPQMLVGNRLDYAIDHLHEELKEFQLARTLEEQLDALVDLTYVALGRILEMGISPTLAFDAVHRANMAKEPCMTDRVEQDAMKPKGWQPPDFTRTLSISAALFNWPERNPKILVVGHARHGKDSVGEILRDAYGLTFTSSSLFCAEHIMMPYFGGQVPGAGVIVDYASTQECFEDRANHRQAWFEAIRDFNRPDASALGRAIFAENDVYVGLRSKAELHALRNSGAVDHVIWVDRSDHVPPEDRRSCTVEPWMADYVVDNNGTPVTLYLNVCQLMDTLLPGETA